MFFVISKTFGRFADPFFLAVFFLILAAISWKRRKAPDLVLFFITAGIGLIIIPSLGIVSYLLMRPLEMTYFHPKRFPDNVGAVVMLTGMTRRVKGDGLFFYELTESADRFTETLRLAHRYPDALIVFSGGTSALVDQEYREAPILERLAREIGLAKERIRVDARSRNTYENAVESHKLLKGVAGIVILITSAFHMRRAKSCFDKVGVQVVPWPVDYRALHFSRNFQSWFFSPWAINQSRIAVREYIGIFAYWLSGFI